MQELIEAVKAWPVIVQGALGSGLFWLVLLVGQKATAAASEAYSRHSKASRIGWLVTASIRYQAAIDNDPSYAAMLIYRSARHLYKGIMWLALGFSIQSILDIGGIIGFAGCIYYLLTAYEVVAPMDPGEDREKKLEQIRKELSDLRET